MPDERSLPKVAIVVDLLDNKGSDLIAGDASKHGVGRYASVDFNGACHVTLDEGCRRECQIDCVWAIRG
jgi:hypothetical protein